MSSKFLEIITLRQYNLVVWSFSGGTLSHSVEDVTSILIYFLNVLNMFYVELCAYPEDKFPAVI